MNRSAIFLALVFMFLFTEPTHADVEGGVKAYFAKDYAAAARLLLPEARVGNPKAQRFVGYMYAYGYGVPKNPTKAFQWFQRAADQGYADGIYDLGRAYYIGIGVSKDRRRGFTLILKAARLGSAAAQSEVGFEYSFGGLVPKNEAKAFYWNRKAARQGNTGGQFSLARHYFYGEGTKQNKVRGLAWMLIAAEKDRRLLDDIFVFKRTMTKFQILAAKLLANRWRAGKR